MRQMLWRGIGGAAVVMAGGLLAGSGQVSGAPTAARTVQALADARGVSAAAAEPPAGTEPPINTDAYKVCANPVGYPAPSPASAFVAGYSNAAKEGSSLLTGFPVPALAESSGPDEGISSNTRTVDGVPDNCFLVTLQLDDDGQREFPPASGSFLAFGFVPVTATVQLVQVGPAPVTGVLYGAASQSNFAEVVTSEMSLQVSGVRVNGVALDVGPDCRTAQPVYTPDPAIDPANDLVVLAGGDSPGDPQPFLGALNGGALAGLVTIPPFAGCTGSDGEDLDGLLTASISGPGNDVQFFQGALCQAPSNCVPGEGNTPAELPSWTITGGGSYTGTVAASLTVNDLNGGGTGVEIICASSAIAGSVPNSAGPPRGLQGTFAWTSIGDCSGTDTERELVNGKRVLVTTPDGTWTATSEESSTLQFLLDQSGIVQGILTGLSLEFTGSDLPGVAGSCTVDLTSEGGKLTYHDADSTLAVTDQPAASTTCPAITATPGLSFSYQLSPPVNVVSP
jgi:hypothetical protein